MAYRFIEDLTSDIMFECEGEDLKELFEEAARALFDIICQRKRIGEKREVVMTVMAEDPEKLLVAWLQELIASVDIDEMFYHDFEIIDIDGKSLKAVCRGEPISKEKGETVVKAVTYYGYIFKTTLQGYYAKVAVDI